MRRVRCIVNAAVDVAIIGAGFAGSLLALICRRLGRSVILLEKTAHPRFAIGESTTPLANLLLEELAVRYDLPRIAKLAKWGTWQRTYPGLACGLKRGFTFYHHRFGESFTGDRRDQLLVAASPSDEIADTHWYRADVDHFFVREAQAAGVEYRERVALEATSFENGAVTLTGQVEGRPFSVRSRCVFDASGPRGFLHRALSMGEGKFENLPETQAIYCHFGGVKRLAEMMSGTSGEVPPFPVDDAAVHHVFPGGWIWVLRFNNGLTSAGVAATDSLAHELNFAESRAAWHKLLERLPTVRAQFSNADPQFACRYSPRLAFRSDRIAGEQWALLPSAAGFVDPLLSTGFPLTLLGVGRLAQIIERDWDSPRFASSLKRYESITAAELTAAAQMVAALYASMNDFSLFCALARIYFAAVSFGEGARRLGLPELAGSFLMHDVAAFGPRCRSLLERATQCPAAAERTRLIAEIEPLIEPFDVVGLGDRDRRNWHPAAAADLLRSAHKFGVTEERIDAMLKRCGFARPIAAMEPLKGERASSPHLLDSFCR